MKWHFLSESTKTTVAPLAGAWIEMAEAAAVAVVAEVAPLAGAWIEIVMVVMMHALTMSRAPRGRVD